MKREPPNYLELAKKRFLSKVELAPSGCWMWKAAALPRGYGISHFSGKRDYAHRIAILIFKGIEIPAGKMVMHSCDVPACVNPDHLSIGDQLQNMRDASKRGRVRNGGTWKAEKNPKTKLSQAIANQIRHLEASGVARKKIAARFSVTVPLVGMICRRQIWTYEEFEERAA